MNRNEKYFFYQWLSINKYIILDLNRNRLETKIKYYIYTGHTNNLDRRLKQHRTNPRNRTKKINNLFGLKSIIQEKTPANESMNLKTGADNINIIQENIMII